MDEMGFYNEGDSENECWYYVFYDCDEKYHEMYIDDESDCIKLDVDSGYYTIYFAPYLFIRLNGKIILSLDKNNIQMNDFLDVNQYGHITSASRQKSLFLIDKLLKLKCFL